MFKLHYKVSKIVLHICLNLILIKSSISSKEINPPKSSNLEDKRGLTVRTLKTHIKFLPIAHQRQSKMLMHNRIKNMTIPKRLSRLLKHSQ